uniref:Retrotransposon gag domain-containing protein n=1 Tax=Nothobranchius furzeri TaxID=105023 RepID=A0A8C6KPY8_NOTFU
MRRWELNSDMTESSDQSANLAESVPSRISETLREHDSTLRTLPEQLSLTNQRLHNLDTAVCRLREQCSAPPPPVPNPVSLVPASSPLPVPALFQVAESPPLMTYEADPSQCFGFLLQCNLAFEHTPTSFSSDLAKISFIIGLLRGRALQWAEAKSRHPSFLQGPLEGFVKDFKLTFGAVEQRSDVSRQLWRLSQGRQSVPEFALCFRTIAAASTWNENSLMGTFQEALNDRIKDQLTLCPESRNLEELIARATCIDQCLRDRFRSSHINPQSPPPSSSRVSPTRFPPMDPDKPIQIGRTRLSLEERNRCMSSKLCLYCGQPGHFISQSPDQPKGSTHQ